MKQNRHPITRRQFLVLGATAAGGALLASLRRGTTTIPYAQAQGTASTIHLPLVYRNSQRVSILNPFGQEPAEVVIKTMQQYGIEQDPLAFREEGFWSHASERSAVVAFETTERALATLEWGLSTAYGQVIERTNEVHYIHVFHLTGLDPNQTYHVRLRIEDRERTSTVYSEDVVIQTRSIPDAIHIPGGTLTSPYIITQSNAYYILDGDIQAERTGIQFADGVQNTTLDLGGHTVSYSRIPISVANSSDLNDAAFGVRCRSNNDGAKILNGWIVQDVANEAFHTTNGFNPVYVSGAPGAEIAGLYMEYSGRQVTGLVLRWGVDNRVAHHNIINDTGNLVADREQLVSAIMIGRDGSGSRVYNNLILKARQCGVGYTDNNTEVYHNEIHVESYAINSYAINLTNTQDGKAYGNKIFGCGCNPLGVVTNAAHNAEVYDNYIWLHGHDLTTLLPYLLEPEGGFQSTRYSTASGVRIRWSGNNALFHDNVILITSRDQIGKARGTFLTAEDDIQDVVFRDNLVIALAEDDYTPAGGAIGGSGETDPPPLPITISDNIIASNFACFNLKDSYGTAENYHFDGNTFVRIGNRSDYHTIRGLAGYGSSGHILLDSSFEGGASYEDSSLGRTEDSFSVAWTLTIIAAPNAQVVVQNSLGAQVFDDVVGSSGTLDIPLIQYVRNGNDPVTYNTPHHVEITSASVTSPYDVTMDGRKTLTHTG